MLYLFMSVCISRKNYKARTTVFRSLKNVEIVEDRRIKYLGIAIKCKNDRMHTSLSYVCTFVTVTI